MKSRILAGGILILLMLGLAAAATAAFALTIDGASDMLLLQAPGIELSSNRGMSNEMTFYLGMRFQEGIFYIGEPQTEPQIDHFYVGNLSALESMYPNDHAVWTLTRTKGTAQLKMDLNNLPDMDLELKALPNGTEDAEWLITCDYGTAHWEAKYTIHFMNSPTGMPTGLEMDFGNVLVVKSGDRLGLADKVRFRNGWNIPGEHVDTMIGGGNNWQDGVTHDDQWIWDVAYQPGVYDCNVSKLCGNIRWIEDFTLIVTNADGTLEANKYTPVGTVWSMPASVTRIEAEAFAGTKLTEVDIPAGVSIAADAFRDTGLIAVYTHNDPDTVDWAVSNGVVALTE